MGENPLLGKGGVAAHQENISVPLNSADGVVRFTSDYRLLEQTTPSAPAKGRFAISLLIGAASPPLPRRGFHTFIRDRNSEKQY
jgi:hypothetical protein